MAATLRTLTLGCKVNQYETELVRQALLSAGYRDAADDEPADLCVVNTCTVTAEADSKGRQSIRQLARRNPQARIVVMGCYATRAPQEVAALPGVAEVVTDKRELPDLLGRFGVVDVPHGISGFGRRHRAYVKVQDGCLLRCTFCIIPQVRPHMYSRPAEHVCDEIQRLVEHGYREIVLTGIHLGHSGVDFNRGRPREQWVRLATLLRQIVRVRERTGVPFRVRLSSIEATEVTRQLVDVLAEFPREICPHLHVCLQSGSDRVLRRMRRRWGVRRLVDRCQWIRQRLDRPALTTDVIVGFPGETDDDFAATCRVVEELGFSKVHVFPFSPRQGTPAADMPDQVPPHVKHHRVRQMLQLEAHCRRRYFQSLVGCTLDVLVESPLDDQPGWVLGTSCRYAPVCWYAPSARAGDLLPVTITAAGDDHLLGPTSDGVRQPCT